eukprot:gnl/TRDRNA2_/TRDRNA2_38216_c0_seq1.p1 gnl/TRDRNA2_/TRDRNA2_38216_c0~~gnl/TRDRNA2_/TRDRNA2_38216_c0_seq1.p1  ORF type:complete len:625 (+),score=148.44 gnl/TRDRNA2_/TRDRNA2_38216_c0_seq1:84-1958(+)
MAPVDASDGALDGLDGMDGMDGAGFDEMLPVFEDLTPFEVEHFVGSLQEFQLQDIGSSSWLTQHERIEKLNWTAHNQAKDGVDEYVIDQLNTLEKLPTLIYDLILIEVWKEKIWPLTKATTAKMSSLRSYIPVYHEASVANLLECCLYHRTACEEAGDALVDLVDWCVRKLRYLVTRPNEELVRQVASAKECAEWDDLRTINEQFIECEFQVSMCVVSIIRFLTDHRVAMPLAVTTRLLDTHDILLLLVPLMEKAPWVRKNRINGRIEKWEEHRWEVVEQEDEGRLPKLQTQVWLAIYNIVMDSECRARYDMSNFRRENLLRLRRFMNEVVVDQLPPLTNLHRALEEMSISGRLQTEAGAPAPAPFVVEMVAEIRESLIRGHEGQWQDIADQQLREVFVKESPEELKRLSQMISIPKDMMEEGPRQGSSVKLDEYGEPVKDDTAVAHAARAVGSAWEAVLALPTVRSTASFFAAAKAVEAPPDEVIMIAAAPQPEPREGERLKLELRRARRSRLGKDLSAQAIAAADAHLMQSRPEKGETFALMVGDKTEASAARWMPFVSQKGAERTARQLRELLEKPGREELLAMYTDDVAEFSIPVLKRDTVSGEEFLDVNLVPGLGLRSA